MSRGLKLALYIVCGIAVIVLGSLTMSSYRDAMKTSQRRAERMARLASIENTNAADTATNATDAITNAAEITNATAAADTGADTNLAATNAAVTNLAAEAKRRADADEISAVAGTSGRGYARMITYGLILLVFVIGLAVMLAYDISHFLASRAEKALFNDDGAPVDPEYDQAEELWKDGKHLEAIQAMREYLNKHPREQYVALRIAEIYEENLFNPVAAALEYEEVLKKSLPAERWGWAAIHLANIYSGKLNQPDKAIALLRRIDSEYGTTSAAIKARERLTQIDPNFVPAAVVAEATVAPPAEEGRPASNLPPGFRPKT